MAGYTLEFMGVTRKAKSKDDVIWDLLAWINGGGVNHVKLTYPDGSYYEFEGGDE